MLNFSYLWAFWKTKSFKIFILSRGAHLQIILNLLNVSFWIHSTCIPCLSKLCPNNDVFLVNSSLSTWILNWIHYLSCLTQVVVWLYNNCLFLDSKIKHTLHYFLYVFLISLWLVFLNTLGTTSPTNFTFIFAQRKCK